MITQFTVGASRTVNLGNYESARVEAQVVVVLDDVTDFVAAKQAAQVELRALLEETYKAQFPKKEKKYERDGYA